MEDIRHWAVEWNVSEEQTAVATVEALRGRAAAGGQVCVPSHGGLPPAFKWLPLPPQYLYFLHKGNSSPAGGAQDSAAAAVALLAEWDACERFPSMTFYLVRRADAR